MERLIARLRAVDPVWWFALAFLGMCCAYESGRVLHLRPQPHHLWRQTDCIALAWNYYDTTTNLFEPAIHNQFADDFTNGKTAGEFPILYWLVGMLWRITGPSEFGYRLIELLLHFAGTLALFASLRRIVDDAFWAGCAALLFYASPVLVYFGISFLTDVPAFDLALIGWWHMTRYAQDRGLKWWIRAVFFFALGMSIKVTAGMSLVALTAVLAFSTLLRARPKGRWSPFEGNWKEWTILAVGYLLVYGWYAYAAAYNNKHGAKYTFNDLWPIWSLTAQEREWAWRTGCDIVVFQVFDTSVWILMGVAFIALATNVRRLPWQVGLLVVTLLLGSVLYTLLWFAALNNHDYYFINPMITLVVLLAGFLWLLARHYPDLLLARWSRWAMLALLVFNVAYTAQNMAMRYDTSGQMSARKLWPLYHEQELSYWNSLGFWGMDDLETIEPRLRAMGVRAEDKVIFLDDGAINSSLVLMGNRGWTSFGHDIMAPGRIDALIAKGARYLLFTRAEWLDDQRLAAYINRPVGQVGSVYIFDLRPGTDNVQGTVVFDQAQGRPSTLQHRLDTVACGAGSGTWCFNGSEFPFEMDGLPTYGPGTNCAVVLVQGTIDWSNDPEEGPQLLIGEDDATHQLALWSKPLGEGHFSLRFSLPQRPEGVRNKLFMTNKSGQRFTMRGLRVEVFTYPGRSASIE